MDFTKLELIFNNSKNYIFENQIAVNTIYNLILALLILLLTFLLTKKLSTITLAKLKKKARKTNNTLDDKIIKILSKLKNPLCVILPVYLGTMFLVLPKEVDDFLENAFLISLIYFGFGTLIEIVSYIFDRKKEEKNTNIDNIDKIKSISIFLIKLGMWLIIGLIILAIFDFDVSTIITSLSLGSVAIALASQQILGDLFSSILIYIDQPFSIGDFIEGNGFLGTVKKVGIKNTRIASSNGEEIIVPNKSLTDNLIHNYKRMTKRRVVFELGLTYETSLVKLKKAKEIIEKIIENHSETELHSITFIKFGDFSLNYKVIFYIKSKDYMKYLKIHESINLQIKEKFEKNKIEIAFPSQTVYIKK